MSLEVNIFKKRSIGDRKGLCTCLNVKDFGEY